MGKVRVGEGFGEASEPSTGYDYDTFTGDLERLMAELGLRDVVLVGSRWTPVRSSGTSRASAPSA
jgi:pimeloyl-ACP methyl ester carboxylesterase